MPKPVDPTVHITWQYQYRYCGNAGCKCQQRGHPGHGPYWYGYYPVRIDGKRRLRTWYLGKQPPPGK